MKQKAREKQLNFNDIYFIYKGGKKNATKLKTLGICIKVPGCNAARRRRLEKGHKRSCPSAFRLRA